MNRMDEASLEASGSGHAGTGFILYILFIHVKKSGRV
jgi:hypothetical protein